MNKNIQNTLIGLTMLFFTACGGNGINEDTNITEDVINYDTKITLIHLNDLHANLLPHNGQVYNENNSSITVKSLGGLARIKTKIDQLRQESEYSILMNIGDTYHGTAEAMFSNGNMIVDLVNDLGVDIGVIGNWDYAYGPIVTHLRFGNISQDDIIRPNFDVIAANAVCTLPDQVLTLNPNIQTRVESALESAFGCKAGDLFLPPTHMIEKNGIKIGFIGLTSDIVDKMHALMGFNLDFTQGKDNYLTLINTYASELKTAGADIVVVMSELGIHKDYALAKELSKDKIQVIFSAHTHELTTAPLITNSGIYVVEAGNDAYIGAMDVVFSPAKEIQSLTWNIYTIDSSVNENSAMVAAISEARAPMLVETPNIGIPQVQLDTLPDIIREMMPVPFTQTLNYSLDHVLGHTDLLLDRRDALESSVNNVVTDLLRNQFSKDIAMTPGFRYDSTVVEDEHQFDGHAYHYFSENEALISGDIKTSDVYRFFPAPYGLAEGNITGANLKAVIEENLNAVFSTQVFEHSGGWFDGFSGLSMDLNLTASHKHRLLSLRRSDDDSVILDSDILTVAGCARPFDMEASTTLCSYNRFTDVQNILNGNNNYAVSDFFIDQILNGNLANIINRKNIQDVSTTGSATFIQPLEGAK